MKQLNLLGVLVLFSTVVLAHNGRPIGKGNRSILSGKSAFAPIPAPVITSFSPLSAPVGATVVITGNYFNTTPASNIVYFGATRANVTAATATALTVTVPAGASYQPISVLNTAVGLSGVSPLSFTVKYGGGALTYSTKSDVASAAAPKIIISGDLDNDGKPDLVYTHQTASGGLSISRNLSTSGTITMSTPQVSATGSYPFGVAIGDVDGDGKKDIIVANENSNTISVYRNTSSVGTIGVAAAITYATSFSPRGLAVGDLDGDGKPEIIASTTGSYTLDIFRNQSSIGALSFAAKQSLTSNLPETVAAVDLDGDGKLDLAATNGNAGGLNAFRNTSSVGAISFAAVQSFTTGAYSVSVAPADIDGDGKVDLAVANRNGSTVSVLVNTSTTGSINFATQQSKAVGSLPLWVVASDVDGDGKADLVAANQNSNSVSVLLNKSVPGTVTLNTNVDYTTGSIPTSVVAADMDGDSKADIIAANSSSNSISYLRNTQLVLPVSGLSLAASKKASGIQLNWSTLVENNSSAFDIEKSTDGISYTKIGTVKAAGTALQKSNYNFEDAHPADGANYYRLAQVDNDGVYKYSPVLIIRWQDSKELTITLAPQPVISTMNVSINGNKNNGDFIIFNASGRMLKRYPVTAGSSTFQVDRTGMPSGIYFYKFVAETGEIKGSGKIVAN